MGATVITGVNIHRDSNKHSCSEVMMIIYIYWLTNITNDIQVDPPPIDRY